MYVKIHTSKFRDIIAICDKDLIGKKVEEGNLQLDITERFYKGEELPEARIISIMQHAEVLNIVGKKSVELAIKNNIIDKNHVLYIKGIPNAQFTKL